jgi:hypothetical protein
LILLYKLVYLSGGDTLISSYFQIDESPKIINYQ